MAEKITQYKIAFIASWIIFCVVYPLWALPVSVAYRFLIFCGLILYLSVAAYILDKFFADIHPDKSLIFRTESLPETLKHNPELVIICVVAVTLHISPLTSPISNFGDEAIHLQGGLWVYDFLGKEWHRIFQIVLWIIIGVAVAGRMKGVRDLLFDRLKSIMNNYAPCTRKNIYLVILLSGLAIYFFVFKDIHYDLLLVRYPPASKFFYLISYFLFGITHTGPRMVQVLFYAGGAIYLYRSIRLFFDRETSFIGATIYLFSPVVFLYSQLAELAAGTGFFIIIISFYFLRYLKSNDERDLLLTTFLIGTGFLYKRVVLLMFFICVIYLICRNIRKWDRRAAIHIKVLLLALVPVIPWMVTGKFYNWRGYSPALSNFASSDLIATYFLLIPRQSSWILFISFLVSIFFVFSKKRNTLTLFFGFLFIAYYIFFTADFTVRYEVHRFSVAFYPTIAVFLALFVSEAAGRLKWRYSSRLAWVFLCAYMIFLCAAPSAKANLLLKRTLKFPGEEAMTWVKDHVKDGEKIMLIRILSSRFYIDKLDIAPNNIVNYWYVIDDVSTPPSLKRVCIKKGINYVMFPFNQAYIQNDLGWPGAEVFKFIRKEGGNEFSEISRFKTDHNYIFVHRSNLMENSYNLNN
jgi:hypothetical protein